MTYRSLLVHLDRDAHNAARCATAIRLARGLDCHLAGVAPTGLLGFPALAAEAAPLIEFAALTRDELRERAEEDAQAFRDDCAAAGLKSFEAVVDEADKAASIARHAHCSDLVVLSRADASQPGHRAAQDIVEQVVLHSARPTLLLPPGAAPAALPGGVPLVAWDDSREAARALSDARPLLRRAACVQVVAWVEDGADDAASLARRLDAVRRWLMWQGVAAETHVETAEGAVGEALLARAAAIGADLVVMGAYGYARWAERVLGGATRHVLGAATLPVLMSH